MDIGKNIVDFFKAPFEQSSSTDVVALLKADHRKVAALFKSFESAEGAEAQQILDTIILELAVHSAAEEDLVYPLLAEKDKCKMEESFEEHHLLKLSLCELADIDASNEQAKPKAKVLCELVKHHVKEEEWSVLPKIKRLGVDLEELGQEVQARKDQLKAHIQQVGKKEGRQRSVPSIAAAIYISEYRKAG